MRISKYIPKLMMYRLLFLLNFTRIFKANGLKPNTIKSIFSGKPVEKMGYLLSNYGVWMYNNSTDYTFRLNILGYRNNLEKILNSMQDSFAFFDVGANQGIFAILASKNKNCKSIQLFEPNKYLRNYLIKNLKFNGVINYSVHFFAISSKSGRIKFFLPDNHSGAATITRNESATHICYAVNRKYINKIIVQENIIFLKIDVEGSELMVLTEFFNSKLAPQIKYIFIEMKSKFGDIILIQKLLNAKNFTEVSRKGNRDSYDALFTKS